MLTASISDSTQEPTTFNGIGSRTYERQSKGHQGKVEAVKAQCRCYLQTALIYRRSVVKVDQFGLLVLEHI